MNPDGTTPDDQAGATPVYSYGYRAPRALDWQAASGLLWVADSSGRESARLRAVVAEADRYKRGSDRAIYVLPPPSTASALAFYRGRLIPAFVDDLLLASTEGRHIRRIHFDARNPTRIAFTETLLQDVIGAIRVVATGRDGAIYFCTTHELAKLVPAE